MAYKTPGVYIVEKDAFPNSVVEVATAVPAFIGYTEKADNSGTSLDGRPWRISSMSEFEKYFGGAPKISYALKFEPAETAKGDAEYAFGGKKYTLGTGSDPKYRLYYGMQLFFQNGGGACYIVSCGKYKDGTISASALWDAPLKALKKEQEPTLIVIPEAMSCPKDEYFAIQTAALMHCAEMKNRFSILDVYDGHLDCTEKPECITEFREKIGTNHLNLGAAYYPWVHTSIVQSRDLDLNAFSPDSLADLQAMLTAEAKAGDPILVEIRKLHADSALLAKGITAAVTAAAAIDGTEGDAKEAASLEAAKAVSEVVNLCPTSAAAELKKQESLAADDNAKAAIQMVLRAAEASMNDLHKALLVRSPLYGKILGQIKEQINLMPPSSAMAGLYTMVDTTRGVWKAPANISMNAVISPAVNLTNENQEDLNVPVSGKAINAIRSFIGEGTIVWGARTLDGNSLDWRYINVRRTMIMLEESIRLASKAYVFEPNTSGTWINMKAMISSFLEGIWKRGGLAGSTPADAFGVYCGLGETMTSEDILEGMLKITVLVALVRPAEFIEITFQQQMQKS